MEKINALNEVRRYSPASGNLNTEIDYATMRLSEARAEMIGHVEEFMSLGGIAYPVKNALGLFSDYLLLCSHIEKLAEKAEKEKNDEAGAIRDEYLPTLGDLYDRFFAIKELLCFITEVGAAEDKADNLERRINALNYKPAAL